MEEWKNVPGYEGLYEVSNLGRVRNKNGHELHYTEWRGYSSVMLYSHSEYKHFKVHRLVAMCFLDNPDGKRTVNHINGIKTDNRACNLEWATHSENHKHAYRTGLRVVSEKQRNAARQTGKRTCAMNRPKRSVYMISDNGERILFESAHAGARYVGGNASAVVRCCRGKMEHHRGWRWAYAD